MADAEDILTLPAEPYLVNGKLTEDVKSFLQVIFACFDEENTGRLDKAGILSILAFGYPGVEIGRLVKSAMTMMEMKMEIDSLSYKQLLQINEDGAKRPEAFKNMIKNMYDSYQQFLGVQRFFAVLENTQLPSFKSELEMIMTMRSIAEEESFEPALSSLDFNGVLEKLKEAKNVVVMAGAGISTSCGIPDFRTPGTGLYDNLQKYDLPNPTAVFEINYFKKRPEAFYELSKEIYPANFNPSPTHYFISLLAKKGKLLRHYTQNIDGLERLAGVPNDLLVEAHGTFHSGHCLECDNTFDERIVRSWIFSDEKPTCPACGGLVKPDITFFGEGLPARFSQTLDDFEKCDLLLVMGTSLVVAPFCNLKDRVGKRCPRVLLNMEAAGLSEGEDGVALFLCTYDASFREFEKEWEAYKQVFNTRMAASQLSTEGFVFPPDEKAYRDVFLQGKCDEKVRELCVELGWADDLDELINTTNEKLKEVRAKLK